jgi:hypothetical protein
MRKFPVLKRSDMRIAPSDVVIMQKSEIERRRPIIETSNIRAA